MPRDIPIGNGRLLVTFDRSYFIRDIYYPCVGKENHSEGRQFKFGIWVDGIFRWVSEGFNISMDYSGDSLVTHVVLSSEELSTSIHSSDIVDLREPIFIRKLIIKNLKEQEREFRVFFHHDFKLLGSPIGDTAYYDPDEKAIIHYKADRYFLISGMREGSHGFDQYATGIKEFQGKEGTWKDAEDGWLEGNPIAQGSVDSVVCFTLNIPKNGEKELYYWICAGKDYTEVSLLNKMILGHGPEYFIKRTYNYWKAWAGKEDPAFNVLPKEIYELFKKSLLILRTNIDSSGCIIAGNDSDIQHFARDTYSYMWPRDGAFTAYALCMARYHEISRNFYNFCLKIVSKGKESVGYFLHKYNPDGSLGSSWHPWLGSKEKILPIQEDGTALVLWALWNHFNWVGDIEFAVELYEHLVRRCGDFLASYRDSETQLPLPSYDLWEENWGIHTFTVSSVYAGLRAAERFANFFGDTRRAKVYPRAADEVKDALIRNLYSQEHGRFLRSLIPQKDGSVEPDPRLDSSLYGVFYFDVLPPDDEMVRNTMNALKDRLWLKTPIGGMARYEGDYYYRVSQNIPGNPWFICTIWLAQWYIAKAKTESELKDALEILMWVSKRALPSGVLAEQINPFTDEPLSVSPLTWSHATFVASVIEYLNKLGTTNPCPTCGSPMGKFHIEIPKKSDRIKI